MYITGIGRAVLELLSFKVGTGNRKTGISLLHKFPCTLSLFSSKYTKFAWSLNPTFGGSALEVKIANLFYVPSQTTLKI